MGGGMLEDFWRVLHASMFVAESLRNVRVGSQH